jgi:hypothetical protein
MIGFGWFRKWKDATIKLRLLAAEVDERINGLAAPIRSGASDTQIQASIQALNDVTETLKLGTGTVRVKGNGK